MIKELIRNNILAPHNSTDVYKGTASPISRLIKPFHKVAVLKPPAGIHCITAFYSPDVATLYIDTHQCNKRTYGNYGFAGGLWHILCPLVL
jgi:hypothetical protein